MPISERAFVVDRKGTTYIKTVVSALHPSAVAKKDGVPPEYMGRTTKSVVTVTTGADGEDVMTLGRCTSGGPESDAPDLDQVFAVETRPIYVRNRR